MMVFLSIIARLSIKQYQPEGRLMLYHIPQVTHVSISFGLVDRLLNAYGDRIGGIKDSGGEVDHLKCFARGFPVISIYGQRPVDP